MHWIPWLVGTLVFLLGGLSVIAVLAQLPGTWVLLGFAVGIELCDGLWLPDGDSTTFGARVLWGCVGVALLGELLEGLAALLGLRLGGGTRRGFWGALIGGIAGLFVCAPLFAFVPFLGPLFGALLGTFLGAWFGELSHPRHREPGVPAGAALRPALWATVGRVLGTTGKVACAIVVWLALTASVFLT